MGGGDPLRGGDLGRGGDRGLPSSSSESLLDGEAGGDLGCFFPTSDRRRGLFGDVSLPTSDRRRCMYYYSRPTAVHTNQNYADRAPGYPGIKFS